MGRFSVGGKRFCVKGGGFSVRGVVILSEGNVVYSFRGKLLSLEGRFSVKKEHLTWDVFLSEGSFSVTWGRFSGLRFECRNV